jgi:hypothetical protein
LGSRIIDEMAITKLYQLLRKDGVAMNMSIMTYKQKCEKFRQLIYLANGLEFPPVPRPYPIIEPIRCRWKNPDELREYIESSAAGENKIAREEKATLWCGQVKRHGTHTTTSRHRGSSHGVCHEGSCHEWVPIKPLQSP